jgi:energy-coupling factor transporter ATP-binding protein EcfA2
MILESIYYSQYDGTPQEWKLEECTLGMINLIVGENASGKSKLLNVIGNLGNILSGSRGAFLSANYKAKFDKDRDKVEYILKCEGNTITDERLSINGDTLLTRGADGLGKIYFQKLNDRVDFQAPSNQVVSVARRDAIQHPFLEDMYDWGRSIRHYYFGTPLGKDQLVVPLKRREVQPESQLDPRNINMVVAMFIDAQKRFSSQFTDSIMQDMEAIGYKLKEIGTAPPISLVVEVAPGEIVGIYAKETDLDGITDQNEMSQGMFRALSLLGQITYSQLTNKPACILIDDIGEGLDYNRSTALVKLLVDKAKETPFQLIMATNDRFVMNSVPLEYWSVMQRIGNKSRIYNYRNSPNLFKEFELTGLNNFDFFSSKYYLKDNRQN